METSYHNRKGNRRRTTQPEKGCEFPIVFMWNLRREKDTTSTSKKVYCAMYYDDLFCFIWRYLHMSQSNDWHMQCIILDKQSVQRNKSLYKHNSFSRYVRCDHGKTVGGGAARRRRRRRDQRGIYLSCFKITLKHCLRFDSLR